MTAEVVDHDHAVAAEGGAAHGEQVRSSVVELGVPTHRHGFRTDNTGRFDSPINQEGVGMSNLTEKLKEEGLKLLPPTLFFFVALHIVALVRILMLKHTSMSIESSAWVALASLILGKAVLLADMLPFIDRFPEKPLAHNILWKTGIYLVMAGFLHYLERLFDASKQAGGIVAGNEQLLADIVWPHFWAVQILMFVLILTYCTMAELTRVLGKERMKRIFFGPLPVAPAR